ncbi:hypothetical protein [Brevibacillus dissolubilis]|uniref:hypothetical protein n=1 Tax=Brevibacillus dissolubilis TaxID=1844116 RepID=UPI001116A2FB|nr:hypothetical protein [Brevibacillus dissolubilis]
METQANVLALVQKSSHKLQTEVERLTERLSLRLDGELPVLQLRGPSDEYAQAVYTLWDADGVITLRAKWQLETGEPIKPTAIPAVLRFSLSFDANDDVEHIQRRIQEYFGREAELHWNISQSGDVGHLELSLHFIYHTDQDMLFAYIRYVLGIITGRVMAA